MLGGFHFNDRKYADDDLIVGLPIATVKPEPLPVTPGGFLPSLADLITGKLAALQFSPGKGEYEANLTRLGDLFSQLDANGDGQISQSEFENAIGPDADKARAQPVDGGGAKRLAVQRKAEEQPQPDNEGDGDDIDGNALAAEAQGPDGEGCIR